jgi:hypothetical protein
MNDESLHELAAVNKFITENVTATNGLRSFVYKDFCGIYCNDSNAFVIGLVQVSACKKFSTLDKLDF